MRPPRTLDRFAVDEFRPGPALGRTKDDHRPAWALQALFPAGRAGRALDVSNLKQYSVECPRKSLMHQARIVTLDEMRVVAVAAEQFGQFLPADAGQHGRVGDLEPVQMKDGKHRAVAGWIEEFVGMPTGGESAGFRFAVANNATDDQIGIVESGAIGVCQRIAEFTAFMDRAGRFRRDVAGNPVRPGKLPE